MQALQSTKLCFGVLRTNSACKIAVRFAGGGGRPGGRPTFNWKERRVLGLDGPKKKEFRAKPIGYDTKELMEHFDPTRGDIEIDITNETEWTEPEQEPVNRYKVVDVGSLYGPQKPFGKLKNKEDKPYKGPYQRRRMSKGYPL